MRRLGGSGGRGSHNLCRFYSFRVASLLLFYVLVFVPGRSLAQDYSCPAGCYCDDKKSDSMPTGIALKINCHPLQSGLMDFTTLPVNTLTLDLAKYELKNLTYEMFISVPHLQKLDLQNNEISHIDDRVFESLSELTLLDLSRNKLKVITTEAFKGLGRLDRLKLNDNQINTIEYGALDDLKKLTKLEISDNPFICDCNLAWFLTWLENTADILSNAPKTKCFLPIDYANAPLMKVNPKSLTCSVPNVGGGFTTTGGSGIGKDFNPRRNGVFEVFPSDNQVVFEGDSIHMGCLVERATESQKIKWLVRGKPFSKLTSPDVNMTIQAKYNSAMNTEETILTVHGLKSPQSGEWTCLLEDGTVEAGSMSKERHRSVNILVIAPTTNLCQPVSTKTSRGTYSWSTAIGGHTVQQSCKKTLPGKPFGFAYHLCREKGQWAANVNTSQCAYNNPVTDTLYKFATMNMTFTPKTLIQSAKQFENFTSDPNVFQGEMDVVYFSQAVANYLPHLLKAGDLGHYIITLIENTLAISPEVLAQSQLRDHACSRLQSVIANVTMGLPAFQHHTNKLAVESYSMKPATFEGVICSWYSTGYEDFANATTRFAPRRVFHCTQANRTRPSRGKVVLASVALPRSLYQHVSRSKREIKTKPFTFAVFSNASLFPTTMPNLGYESVQATVIGSTYFGRYDFGNITMDPIVVTIRGKRAIRNPAKVQPVWWDPDSNGGFGSWRPDYCYLISVKANAVRFICNRLGYYSYQEVSYTAEKTESDTKALFRFHHPLIYVGSVICIVLVTVSIIVYSLYFTSIRISRKLKHALINFWVALVALVFLYTSGIHQTEHETTCRSVGFGLHYLSLCNLVWLVISVNVIYKKVNKHNLVLARQSNAMTTLRSNSDQQQHHHQIRRNQQKAKKPLTKFYLIGWGMSLAICFITVAINVNNYGTNSHCFMNMNPFLGALIVPGAICTALLIGFGLSAWVLSASSPSHITEQIEVDDLLGHQNRHDNRAQSLTSLNMTSATAVKPDREKTVKSLLLAHAYIYVLLLSTWMCGSLAVVQPLEGNLPYEELIFSILFTISSISLGVFVFVYFCLSRHDVQECWRHSCHAGGSDHDGVDGRRGDGTAPVTSMEDMTNLANNAYQRQMPSQQNSNVGGYTSEHQMGGGGAATDKQLYSGAAGEGTTYDQQQQHHDSFKIYEGSSTNFGVGQQNHHQQNSGRVKETNNLRNQVHHQQLHNSDGAQSSDHMSLNNFNHLRRGFVAPVNSAGASEAEIYGLYGAGGINAPSSIFGPVSSKVNNTNIHVEPSVISASYNNHSKLSTLSPDQNPPKTSSPTGNHPAPKLGQDIMVSPLGTGESHHPQNYPNLNLKEDRSLDSVNNHELEYTESSTIKVGAPCQMASFALHPREEEPRTRPGFLKPNSVPRKTALERHKRSHTKHQQRYKTIPDNEDDGIEKADADALDTFETQSKVSGVSSAISSRSGRPRKRQRRPNRKKPREALDAAQSIAAAAKLAEQAKNKKNRGKNAEDQYLGDDDYFDTMEKPRRARTSSIENLDPDSREAMHDDISLSSSQYDQQPEVLSSNRETSV